MSDQTQGDDARYHPGDEIEITENDVPSQAEAELVCSQCQTVIPAGTGIATESAVFCQLCYGQLTSMVEAAVAEQGHNINYLGAVAGGLLGGMLGAAVWWGFTTVTNIQFGLVAVIIGWGAGKGVVTLSGGKRALPLQLISLAITLVSYGLATYWVTRTYIIRYMAENGVQAEVPFFPDPGLFLGIVRSGFELFDLIFLAIALWQAWKMPSPIVLQKSE